MEITMSKHRSIVKKVKLKEIQTTYAMNEIHVIMENIF